MAELNIVGTIISSDIVEFFPKDAQFAHCGHVSGSISKFYKWKTIEFNDTTSKEILHYWSEQGGWYPSEYNVDDKLSSVKLYKIEG